MLILASLRKPNSIMTCTRLCVLGILLFARKQLVHTKVVLLSSFVHLTLFLLLLGQLKAFDRMVPMSSPVLLFPDLVNGLSLVVISLLRKVVPWVMTTPFFIYKKLSPVVTFTTLFSLVTSTSIFVILMTIVPRILQRSLRFLVCLMSPIVFRTLVVGGLGLKCVRVTTFVA